MAVFLYKFFHEQTSDRTEGGRVHVPADETEWPESWTKIYYKQYALFKSVPLPETVHSPLRDILFRRRSSEKYLSASAVKLSTLSHILKCGYGLQGGDATEYREENRTVPSAGKRYPLEIYVLLFKTLEGCEAGIYHYGIKNHELEPITVAHLSREDILSFSPQQEWLTRSSGMICMTGIFSRTTDKYGSRGYRYTLIEAGHVAQNMLLAGTEKGANIVPIGGVEEKTIEKALGLNNSGERAVYALYF